MSDGPRTGWTPERRREASRRARLAARDALPMLQDMIARFVDAPAAERARLVVHGLELAGLGAVDAAWFCDELGTRCHETARAVRQARAKAPST